MGMTNDEGLHLRGGERVDERDNEPYDDERFIVPLFKFCIISFTAIYVKAFTSSHAHADQRLQANRAT